MNAADVYVVSSGNTHDCCCTTEPVAATVSVSTCVASSLHTLVAVTVE